MQKYSSYILFMLISTLVLVLYANGFGPLDRLQRSISDTLAVMTANEERVPGVTLVTIDGTTQNTYGAWPWNHDRIADLIAAIGTGSPKAVVLDFVITEDVDQDTAGFTDILADQVAWVKNVVIPYDISLANFRSNKTDNPKYLFDYAVNVANPVGLMEEGATLQVRKVFLPPEKLLLSDPLLGFEFTEPDEDRQVRRQPLLMNFDGYYYPSVALMAAAAYYGVPSTDITVVENEAVLIGDSARVPIDEHSSLFIKFSRDESFRTISADRVLGEGFDFNILNNQVVIVEVQDFANGNSFTTPVIDDAGRSMIRANVIENIVNRNFLVVKRDLTMINMLIILAIGALAAFSLRQVTMVFRVVILFGSLLVLANLTYFLFSSFSVITDTVYFGLQLVLFLAVSPLLDSELVLGKDAVRAREKAKKKARVLAQQPAGATAAGMTGGVPVRELSDNPDDPENIDTAVVGADSQRGVKTAHTGVRDLDEEIDRADSDDLSGSLSIEDFDSSIKKSGSGEVASASGRVSQSGRTPQIITPDSTHTKITLDSGAVEIVKASSGSLRAGDSGGVSTSDGVRNLGRYQIIGTLGKGAMGHVYKGIDPAINRPVALKTIRLDFVNDPDELEELKERLHREAQAAGKLSHPNIVTIYDVGSEGELQYIAMEYLEGRTLEDMIKKKVKFNYRIIANILVQICSALDYAHEQGIVHRDVKPANIMILSDYRVKVMDFGIARIDSNSMTKTGIAMGTPNYISPEQLQGKAVDKRADLFSLGVVMYEMLLGRRPFRGENITSLIYAIIHNEPMKPSNVNPQIPLLFDHIVDKALRKDPIQRYQNARDIIGDLHDFVETFVR